MSGPAILTLAAIAKAFAGIHAVRDVSLAVGRGRILGLVGENGAGKSTLMNIIGGVVRPDGGTMLLDGAPYAPASPGEASRAGIAFIHQELNLFSNLTIAENIFLNDFPQRRFGPFSLIDRAAVARQARALLSEVSLDLPPETPLDRLSPGERQLVEVARALRLDARIIIFDEPTTSLTARETERLFALVARLREAGKSVIYISHILTDVAALADDIAVLRDGALIEAGAKAQFPIARMITLMVGRPIDQLYPPRKSAPQAAVLLEAISLGATGIIRDVSFALHRGEVLGIFGLMGAGRTELARILFGLDSHETGEIRVEGRRLPARSARASIRSGIAFITENRREEGLLMNGTVAENIALAALPRLAITPAELIEQGRIRSAAGALAEALNIKTASLDAPAKSLSGGNQQKVVLAKWLLCRPSVFIMDEPTRGIDVGAKYEIYSIIDRLAGAGGGVLFISSELEELLAVCDRILVMSRGEIVGEFARAGFDRGRVLAAAFREAAA
ncbi:MAG TPA: sugar ABC transporter ATP-binding protein [Bauldia sp.]|nr:sugar ABC transporter ATP-binding protein [Bauldia sp.]